MLFCKIDSSLLVMLVIIALSALSSWMQKRSQTKELGLPDRDTDPPRPPRPSRPTLSPPGSETAPTAPEPSGRSDWERELRRLFEGDVPASPPPVARPPVVIQQAKPAPPPVTAASRSAPPPLQTRSMGDEGPSISLSELSESEEAYRKARQLHEQTAVRLRQATEHTKQHRPQGASVHRKAASAEVLSARGLLRDPRRARQAIVASLILEPPKAFGS